MPNAVRSVCPFCAMGCTLFLSPGTGAPYVGEADVARLDYDAEGLFNRGSLCAKGNMALELLTHPGRLEEPRMRSDGHSAPVSWDEALRHVAASVAMVRDASGPGAIGILLGPTLTNEEVRAAVALGRKIGTPHVDGGQPEDRVLLSGIERSGAAPRRITRVETIERMEVVLTVGDLFSVAPCLARSVMESRYDRRQNRLGTLGGVPTRTAWFGKPDLRCAPAHEAAALALMLSLALERPEAKDRPWAEAARAVLADRALASLSGLDVGAAQGFVDALFATEASGVLVAPTFGGTERPDLVGGLAALLADLTRSPFLALAQGPNSPGVRRTLEEEGYPLAGGLTAPLMVESVVTGDLDALLVFGCDPLGSLPGPLPLQAAKRLSLFAVTAPLSSESTARADVVLPTAAWGEKEGTVIGAFGERMALAAALSAPGAARPDLAVLRDLAALVPGAGVRPTDVAGRPAAPSEAAFLSDLELYLRSERREGRARTPGTHLLLPEVSPAQSGDGWLTRPLSWPRHETPHPEIALSGAQARALDLAPGDRARVRSSQGEVVLRVRIEDRLPDEVALAPAHEPGVRRLLRWHLDPVTRDLDLEPGRVSVERAEENGHA